MFNISNEYSSDLSGHVQEVARKLKSVDPRFWSYVTGFSQHLPPILTWN